MKGSTEKRLLHYAWQFKRGIMIGIACLLIAVALELAGPLIAKTIIDDHILGVEGEWQEVLTTEDTPVTFDGKTYKRLDRLTEGDVLGETIATVFQVQRDYYFVAAPVPLQGKRTVEGNVITIDKTTGVETFVGEKLTMSDIYPFFKPEQRPILLLLGLYMGLIVIAGVFHFFQTFILQKTSNLIVKKIRNDVFTHTQKVPINYFIDQPAGGIVSRITNDTEAIRDLYERVLSMMVTSIIYMAGIFVALFFLDKHLALYALLLIPLIYGWMKLYKHYGSKYNQVIRSTVGRINGNINEAIQGMPIIQAFNREKQTKAEFETLNERHFTYQRKLVRLGALTSHNLVTTLRNLTFVGFVWYFGSASLEPSSIISIGMLYAFVDYITRLFEPVLSIVNQLPLVEQARVAGTRVFTLMDHPGEEINHRPIARYEGDIAFDDVSFSYDGKNNVLHDLSFQVKAGETVAFVGHTGSGKSTIMNLLFRFYDPQVGKINIDGHDISQWSRQQVRSHMGIVLQDPFLFTGTIISNVTLNDPRITDDMAIDALIAVGADRFITKLADGYQTEVTENGGTFSLGERQLISFARALAFNPAILILDEATANIDSETERLIQHALDVLKQGRTTLVIAHRLSTIQQADKIYVLEHGMIKEAGNHEELLEAAGIYFQMHEMQRGSLL